MNKNSILNGLVCAAFLSSMMTPLCAEEPSIGPEMREGIEWCQIRHMNANRVTLPRVLLVGDSIVGGHNYQVYEQLKEIADSSWLMTSRCMGDPAFDQELDMVLGLYDYAVIYFNNGLHGASFSDEQYERALARTFEKLAALDAVMVWRDSTLINPDIEDDAGRARISRRNEIARAYAGKYNFKTDNLGTFDAESYTDKLHYTPAAAGVQAEHVARTIKKLIETN